MINREILSRLNAAFVRGLQEAVVARSHPLLEGGLGQEVARQLLDGKAVEIAGRLVADLVNAQIQGQYLLASEADEIIILAVRK